MCFSYSVEMAHKRRRTSGKRKCSKKPFVVSLNSRKRKGVTTNYQVQKRLESLSQKRGKIGKSTGRRFYRCYTRSHCSFVVTSSHKGSKTDTSLKMVKEFVLIKRQEYDHPTLSENMNAMSMLSIQQLLTAVKSRVSNVHDMLDYLFHDWRKLSKQSPSQGLDKLIRILFQNGFDPQNVVNRRLRVFCHANEPHKSTSLLKSKQKSIQRQGIRWLVY